MPAARENVTRKALAEGWQFRQRSGRGGGREYALASLPTETRIALLGPNCNIPDCTTDNTKLDCNSEPAKRTTCARNKQNKLSALPVQLASIVAPPNTTVESNIARVSYSCRSIYPNRHHERSRFLQLDYPKIGGRSLAAVPLPLSLSPRRLGLRPMWLSLTSQSPSINRRLVGQPEGAAFLPEGTFGRVGTSMSVSVCRTQ